MKDKVFIDTNLWIYLYDTRDEVKQKKVKALIHDKFDDIMISTQVLNEIYNILSKKIKLVHPAIQEIIIETITNFQVAEIGIIEVIKAMDIKGKYGFSYWDSLIIAAALENDCNFLFSEDMQNGQIIENKLKIVSPF